MDFIAKVPVSLYVLIPIDDFVCGILVGEDTVEFFTNELLCETFQILTSSDLKKLVYASSKVWGNPDLLDLIK